MKKFVSVLGLLALFAVSVPSWGMSCASAAACTSGGTPVASLLNQTTVPSPGATKAPIGTVSSWVFSGDANNTLGGLTFVFQVALTKDDLSSITFGGFGPSSLGTWSSNPGEASPMFAGNNLNGGETFYFIPNAQAPFTSDFLIVYTNLPSYSDYTASLNDTGTSVADTLGSLPGVPEPASMALFGSGLVGMARVIRRRKGSPAKSKDSNESSNA